MVSVLLVDDSPVERAMLAALLEEDPELTMVGSVANAREALAFLARQRPDVVAMDLTMPGMNGVEATQCIMETTPVPIVVFSAATPGAAVGDAPSMAAAIEGGAVAGVRKPAGPGHPEHALLRAEFLRTLKTMAQVKVIRRWPRYRELLRDAVEPPPTAPPVPTPLHSLPSARTKRPRVVAIGVSTGGPPVLQTVLSALPGDFAAPILVVQHIAHGFLGGLIDWLRRTTALAIEVPSHGQPAEAGHVYIAPDDTHLGMDRYDHIVLDRGSAEYGFRPSVSYLFRSVAGSVGGDAIAVLLTGMGRDGARELRYLRDLGATTIVQNEESCAVFGMPAEAIKLGAANYVLPPVGIAAALSTLVSLTSPVREGTLRHSRDGDLMNAPLGKECLR